MQAQRRVRPTIRCLREDLGIELPSLDVDVGSIEHPMLVEARRLATVIEDAEKRILSIKRPIVYRLRVGDFRGAAWVDEEHNVVWVCAVNRREEGSEDDAYQRFAELHDADRLLPTDDDQLRDRAETVIRLQRGLTDELLDALDVALSRPTEEVQVELGGWIPCRLLVLPSADVSEVWCALAIIGRNRGPIPERLRDVLFAALEQRLAPVLSEARADWPRGIAEWSEVVRLYLRGAD